MRSATVGLATVMSQFLDDAQPSALSYQDFGLGAQGLGQPKFIRIVCIVFSCRAHSISRGAGGGSRMRYVYMYTFFHTGNLFTSFHLQGFLAAPRLRNLLECSLSSFEALTP